MAEDYMKSKLDQRKEQHALRALSLPQAKIDFCSNDYLGLAHNEAFQLAIAGEIRGKKLPHGSTGSRLLSGNYPYIEETEKKIASFHDGEAALLFNSGFDANLGLMSCMASRDEVIFYDSLIHASLRDGIRLSRAASYSFPHNNLSKLEEKLARQKAKCFVVVESIYSMDGDQSPLAEIASLCKRYSACLVVDEAHATGVAGSKGAGLVQQLGLQQNCFARIHTFGKALGVHGAAVVGSSILKGYLINYARSFIYTTALPPASVAAIHMAYDYFPAMDLERDTLKKLISAFQQVKLPFEKLHSETPIQILMTPGNEKAREISSYLLQQGMDVRPIMYPTVPIGKERLRLVLHSYNSMEELNQLADALHGLS